MIITKKIPVGANVTWEARSENYFPQHGSFIMPNTIKKLDINLESAGDYWAIFSGEGNPTIYAYFYPTEYENVHSPVLKRDYEGDLESIEFGHNADSMDLITEVTWLDTSRLTKADFMFSNCHNLKSVPALFFNKNMSMQHMFKDCRSLVNIPPITLRSFINGTEIECFPTKMNSMFAGCTSLKSVPALNTRKVSNFDFTFSGCTSIETVPDLDFASAIHVTQMFKDCSSLKSVRIIKGSREYESGSLTDASHMFAGCSSLQKVELICPAHDNPFRNVTNASQMFDGCSSLGEIDIDLRSVTNSNWLFRNCSELRRATIDFREATLLTKVFEGCSKLEEVKFNTDGPYDYGTMYVTNMQGLFRGCSNLRSVEGIYFNSIGDFSSALDLFGTTSDLPLLTHFIVGGRINFSWNREQGLHQLVNLDYDSIKSILEAMSRTSNTDAKVMKLNCSAPDPDGELAGLVSVCSTKGWTITGLNLN